MIIRFSKLMHRALKPLRFPLAKHFLHSKLPGYIVLSDEVREALASKRPLVALESTIITHGMPFPSNLQTAQQVEKIIRGNDAIPATIAVLSGKVHVGLTDLELESLSRLQIPTVKTSRRDLPVVLSQGLTGGTTVSCTMIVAHKVGIPVFVTGGIGGVHRGAESSMDISADLMELGRTPVSVVCAGVKSILDIRRTLEYLETQGVCVSTFGESKEFPAFFTSHSGFMAPHNLTNAAEAAMCIDKNLALDIGSGMVIAVPIPSDAEATGEIIDRAVQQALQDAKIERITGKEVTPFILQRVNDLTGGKSLEANITLIKNNADVGSKIAVELNKLQKHGSPNGHSGTNYQRRRKLKKSQRPVSIGGSMVDFVARSKVENMQSNGATYEGHIHQSCGGVARNTAEGISRLGCSPLLISAIGDDSHGKYILDHCSSCMDTSGVVTVQGKSTGTYNAVLDSRGKLVFGIGDMDIHQCISTEMVSNFEQELTDASLVFLDGNTPATTMEYICEICHDYRIPVWFEPTDIYKASKPFNNALKACPTFISPNLNELLVIHRQITGTEQHQVCLTENQKSLDQKVAEILSVIGPVIEVVPFVFVSVGSSGLVVCQRTNHSLPKRGFLIQEGNGISVMHYPPCLEEQRPKTIASVSGGGDSLNAGIISGMLRGHDLDVAIKMGLLAAQYSLATYDAIPNSLNTYDFSAENITKWAPWKPNHIVNNDERQLL